MGFRYFRNELGLGLLLFENTTFRQAGLEILDSCNAFVGKPQRVCGQEHHRLACEVESELIGEDPIDRHFIGPPRTEFLAVGSYDDVDVVYAQHNGDAGSGICWKSEMSPKIH